MKVQGKRILIFGDSLSYGNHSPGGMLRTHLLQTGAKHVRVSAKVGRSLYGYFTQEDRSLRKLTREAALSPDVVFIMLGTNEIGHDLKVERHYFEKLRDTFSMAEVWGIGPPSLRWKTKTAAVVKMMASVFNPRFIDARPLTSLSSGRAHDGVHFTVAGAQTFARRLATTLGLSRKNPLKVPFTVSLLGGGLAFILNRRNKLM